MASVAHRAPRLDSTHTYHAIASSVASYPLLSLTNLKRKRDTRGHVSLFHGSNNRITCSSERYSAEPSNGELSGLTVGEVSKHTTVLAKPTEQREESLVILSVVLSTLLGAPLVPILTAENNLAHTDGFRSDFHALVLVGEVQGLFEAHLDRRSQGFEHICGGGTP